MYSQNNEEQIIAEILATKEIGANRRYFVDIGAYHPTIFSNVRRLVEQGWGGVFVEPSKSCQQNFIEFYQDQINTRAVYGEPRAKQYNLWLLPFLITQDVSKRVNDVLPFHDSGGDAISTVSDAHRVKWELGYQAKYTTTSAIAFTMKELFDGFIFGSTFEKFCFLNIDVEGINLELFNAIPWQIWAQIEVLCIEHDGHQEHMKAEAIKRGFELKLENPENLIFSRI